MKMTIKNFISVFGTVLCAVILSCFVPFLSYVVFPLFNSFSPESRLEQFVDEHCLQGNEIAILIRRERISRYLEKDYMLIRAAIEGNENAIKALKLDPGTRKGKSY
jgi:hypothetical protein